LAKPDSTAEGLRLPKVLDLAAAAPLKTELAKLRGKAALLDASDVQRVGALCAQVLLSAQRTWTIESQEFRYVHASEAFREGLERMGVEEMLQAVEIAA
jgi:chemotaxis protein CheX